MKRLEIDGSKGVHMKRLLGVSAVMILAAMLSPVVRAQDDPFLGTWKLDVAKSQFKGAPPPKEETRTGVKEGSATRITFRGIAADGSKIDFTFITRYDNKPEPFSGTTVPGGAATVAIERVDAHTTVAHHFTKDGKPLWTTKNILSDSWKASTMTRTGKDANGKPMDQVTVWEKQ
jgi:hypothetical protein